jgi:hypothetical protein
MFVLGALIGAIAMDFLRQPPHRDHPDTGPMIHVESMLLANQYEAQRHNGAWPNPASITSYLTRYQGSCTRTMGDGTRWRVDVYRMNDSIRHFHRYLLIGLDPDGTGYFLEERDDAPPNQALQLTSTRAMMD